MSFCLPAYGKSALGRRSAIWVDNWETTFKRENDIGYIGMQHMEHGFHVMNRDNEMGMRRPDEYRDSQDLQS